MTDDELIARILYRDGQMLIVDKPAGIPVHGGFGGGETLDQHFPALQFGLPNPPQLAHRLDKDTSGCLVLGRHRRSIRELGEMFAAQKIAKTYLAVLVGQMPEDEGVIDAPLAKLVHDKRSWWMKVDPSGQPSVTDYRVVARGDKLCIVDLFPRTGRTHQLRVHTAFLGCPIVGDGVYGGDLARGVDKRLHLHARHISVPLYKKKPVIEAEALVPEHMTRLLGRLGAIDEDGWLRHVPRPVAAQAEIETEPEATPS